MKRTQLWQGIAASISMGILILDNKTALSGAKAGIEMCIQSLIPALFPFFIVSSLLTGAFGGTSVPLLKPVGRLLHIPSGAESILIPAYLGGYPAGAQCIGQAEKQGSISKTSAQRLLLFCNNPGPSFLFGVLGPVFSQGWVPWALWGILITSSILCSWILPGNEKPGRMSAITSVSMVESLTASVRTTGSVCGWVILFRIVIAFGDKWILWLFPEAVQTTLAGLLELSNGCMRLTAITDLKLRFLVCAGLLSFGGSCVIMQTASVTSSFSILPYIFSKFLQGLCSIGLGAAFLYKQPTIVILIIAVCWFLKKVLAIRSSMVYNETINLRRNPYAVSKKNGSGLRLLSSRHTDGRRSDSVCKTRAAKS